MARRRTWDSEAYTPYYEDDDPSLYRPSIWRRLLLIAIVLVPIGAAALLIYSFIRAYIAPPRVAVAPTSIALREPNSAGPMAAALRERGLARSLDLQAAPPEVQPPTLPVARPRPEPRVSTPQEDSSAATLPWPGTAPAVPRATAPPPAPAEIATGSIIAPEAVPLPRRRPRLAADTLSRSPTDTTQTTPVPEVESGPSYGTPN